MDGTQKIPQRWLASIARLREQGKPASALPFALAAWIAFVCTPGRELDDPLAGRLVEIRNRSRDAAAAVNAILGEGGVLPVSWHADSAQMQRIQAQVAAIGQQGMRHALRQVLISSTLPHRET
jgi:fructuronate reductase